MYTIKELFDLSHTTAEKYLSGFVYPHEALAGIGDFVRALGEELSEEDYPTVAPGVRIHKTASVAPTASIGAPCVIGAHTEVRPGAFIRGNALIGADCVIGNSTEIKNAVIFDGVQVPHYNYVGDSILGYRAHMGAGAVTSNVKGDKSEVVLRDGDERMATGRKKVGAFLGDMAEVGCNCVLNPGTVIGRGSRIYPLSSVRGTVKENHIYKQNGEIVPIRKRTADDAGKKR